MTAPRTAYSPFWWLVVLVLSLSVVPGARAGGDPEHHATPAGVEGAMDTVPLIHGTLSGAAAEGRLAQFVRDWQAARDEHRSTRPVFDAYLTELGSARIIAHFEAQNAACHGALHNLGKVVARRTNDLVSAMAVCSNACTYACVHGAVKTHFADRVERQGPQAKPAIAAELVALCDAEPLVADFFAGNCAHTAGHAFAIIADGRLRHAVDQCDAFPDPELRYYCETGVFMQLMGRLDRDVAPSATLTRAQRIDARLRFCFHAARNVGACMRFHLTDYRRRDDLLRIRANCERMAAKTRLACFNGMGYLARSYVISRPDRLAKVCGTGSFDDRAQCVGAVAFAKKDHANHDRIDQACNSLRDEALRRVCTDQHQRYYYQPGNRLLQSML